ncbi:uncharacterized protein LOC130284114 isoform X2 [Hyla sarda]|nr:uncharacterized protein LOC130284114 isoform X2 [Hyla sarda]
MGKDGQIPCSFTVDNPPVDRSQLVIIWYFQDKQILRVDDKSEKTTNPRLSSVDRIWDGVANLYISNTSLSDGGLYKCSVIYGSLLKEAYIRLDILAPPLVTITGKTVVMNRENILHCTVTGFYPVDIDIRWFRGAEMLTNVTVENPRRNHDGVYNVNSSVRIIPTEEDRDQNFSCRVQHESLQQPHREIFQLFYGAAPIIHILPHLFKKNVEQILVCYVSGFYPESIVVNWLLNGTSVEKTEIKRINSSALEAALHFMPTEKNWGMEVTCVVEHETLLHPQAKSLTVLGKDFTAKYKLLVVLAAALLSVLFVTGTVCFYMNRYKQKRHPKFRTITQSTDGSFSLNIDHFYPKEISVSWEVFQPPSNKTPKELQSTNNMQENQDGTFNVTSTTESLRDKVNEREEYKLRAAVTHQKLRHPSYREWTNQNKDNLSFMSSPELGQIVTPNLMLNSQAQLQCTISRFYPDNLTVNWIRKVMGNEEIITTSEKYKLVPQRSQQQRDKTFTCTACLLLTPSLEDRGSEIICRATHPSLEQPAERSTGQLQVWVKPTIDHPIQLSISDSGDVMATLSLLKFYPKDIIITWSYGRSLEKKSSQETVTDNPDGAFSINTKCIIPGNLFEEKDFRIKVTWRHETMDIEEFREMFLGHPDFPWCPRILDMTPLILQMGKETTVTCKISAFFPNNLTVTWYEKKGTSITQCTGGKYNITCAPERAADNSCSCSASLSFTAQSQSDDLEFICRVLHPSLKNPIERSTGKAMMRVTPQMEEPVKLTLDDPDTVKSSMTLTKFYPSDVKIAWTSREYNDKPIPSTRKRIQTDEEQTFDAISECTVPWRYFLSGVRVTWEHQSLTSPQHRDLYITDFPWHPVIEEINKPFFVVDTEDVLQCKISHYFPNDLTVSWFMKKKRNLTMMANTKFRAERQGDNTYSCTATLIVTPSVQEYDGAEIICRVQHPSLERYIEKSTGPIQVYAPPRFQDPIQWSLSQNEDVLCILRLQRFYPKPIEITWSSSDGSVKSREIYEDHPDSTCNVTSQCTVTQKNINDPNFRITVTWKHNSMVEPEKKKMYIRNAGIPWHPTVSELFTPILSQNEVQVHCNITRYFPHKLTVTWLVKERGSDAYIPVDPQRYQYQIQPMKDQDAGTGYHSTAALQFRPVLTHHHGIWFMCKVEHPSLELPIERTTGPVYIPLTPELREEKIITTCDKSEVLCSMNLRRFFPKKINITWVNGKSDVMASKTILQVNDEEEEAFDAISECRIPWEKLIFPVQVTWKHESMAANQCLHLQRTEVLRTPILQDIEQSVLVEMIEAELHCRISRYFPDDVTVSWYKKKGVLGSAPLHDNDKYKISVTESQKQPDSTFSCTASLRFTPTLEHQESEIICLVEHPSLETPLERSSGPLRVRNFSSCPILQDIEQSVLVEMIEAELKCRISGYFPDDVTVSWYKKEKGVLGSAPLHDNDKYKTSVTESQKQPDSTFSCTASLRFTPTLEHQESEIICLVEHPSLETPLERSSGPLRVRNIPSRPFIEEIDASDLTANSPESELHCRISGYFPDDVTVSWYKKEKGVLGSAPLHDNDKYKTSVTESQKQPDSTFSCTASLRFTPTLEHQESEIICLVEHPSLETPLERSSGPLKIKGLTDDLQFVCPTEETNGPRGSNV